MNEYTCVYHANCLDGLAAAAAILALNSALEGTFIAAEHGKPLPKLPGSGTLFVVDFSLTAEGYAEAAEQFDQVVTIDHHIGSKPVIEAATQNYYGVCSHYFDNDVSGAVAVCNFFKTGVPLLVSLIGDRDIWKWELADTPAATAWLFAHMPATPAAMLSVIAQFDDDPDFRKELLAWGRTKTEVDNKFVEDICARGFARNLFGVDAICVYTSIMKSEVGNKLLELNPEFPVSITIDPDGSEEVKLSFRSLDGQSALLMARNFSGGGHGNASGGKGLLTQFAE